MELQRRSSGTAKAGLATGIVGASLGTLGVLGALGNGMSNVFGRSNQPIVVTDGNGCYPVGYNAGGRCNEDHVVNRYELELQQKLAEKDAQIALRDANTYNDQKLLEVYKYVDGRFREFEQAFAAQAVSNQKTADDVLRVQANLDCCCKELRDKICDERRERKCNDNLIVTYANATFYSKLIAGITASTTTTEQPTFNPLPQTNDGCCCNN